MPYDRSVLRFILLASMPATAGFSQTVDGHVVNSVTGVDIPGVAVNLLRAGATAYSATTDSQGHFRIESVKAGAYMANYSAHGFFPIPNFSTDGLFELVDCGRCFLTERGDQPFQVVGGEDPVRLEVKMAPLGRISGKVLDDVGDPVPDADIQLFWGENWLCKMPYCMGFSRQSKTNEKGEYSITGLDVPGAWLLSAIAPSSRRPAESRGDQRLGWAQTFYPGVTDPQLAVKVMVRFGADISNVDIKLAAVPVHRIRGVVLDSSGNPVPKAGVTLGRGIGSSLVQNTRGDGTFEFDAVTEGEWRISAKAAQGSHQLWLAQWVRLKGHDVEKIELRPATPFAIRGKVEMDVVLGALAPKPPGVLLAFNAGAAGLEANNEAPSRAAAPDAKGDFEVQNLYPGTYQIVPGPAPPQYYLDSIRIGDRDALESGVEMIPGAQPLTVAYKFGGGTVRGTVERCAGGTVRLLPQDKAMWRQGFAFFAACDSNDRYEIHAVRPGQYYALAIAGDSSTPWYGAMWEDDGLLRNASTITVRAGESSMADLRATRQ
jgi:uncharacterized GH25 family protein